MGTHQTQNVVSGAEPMAPNTASRGLHIRGVVCILCGHVGTANPGTVASGGDGGGVCQCVDAAPQRQIPRGFPHIQAKNLS